MSENPEFSSLEDLLRFAAKKAQKAQAFDAELSKATDKAMLFRDGVIQRLRLKLTEMVDDPTHRLTERGFACALAAFSCACEGVILVALKNTQPITDALIVRSVIEYLSYVAAEMESNPCSCENCQ